MISSSAAVALAIETARAGLQAGEMPVGAAVFVGDRAVSTAFTQEQQQRRRIVHADLLALEQADRELGFQRPSEAITLAINLEPCMMCLGAAITLGVSRVFYALESPNDGAVALLDAWHPPVEQSFFQRPAEIQGGILRAESQALFAEYASGSGPAGMRAWARGLASNQVG